MATLFRRRVNFEGGIVENTSVTVGSVLGLKSADTVVTDGATTNASTTVTSATAAFTSDDVGMTIAGSGIPAGATIASVTNATTVVISAAATATATGVTLTIGRSTLLRCSALAAAPALGTDEYFVLSINPDGEWGLAPEIAYVTAHSAGATTATILRAQEGTAAPTNGWPQDTYIVCAPSAYDFAQPKLLVDESGSSLANWTQDSGSWTTSGGIISAPAGGGIIHYSGPNAVSGRLPLVGPLIAQWDARNVGANDIRVIFGNNGTTVANYGLSARLNHSAGTAGGEVVGALYTGRTLTGYALNTWFSFRAVVTGQRLTTYAKMSGTWTLLDTVESGVDQMAIDFLTIQASAGQADFRNIVLYGSTPDSLIPWLA